MNNGRGSYDQVNLADVKGRREEGKLVIPARVDTRLKEAEEVVLERGKSYEIQAGSIEYPVLLPHPCCITASEAATYLRFEQISGLAIAPRCLYVPS